MQICKLQDCQLPKAVTFVKEVFDGSLAKQYGELGIQTFYRFIRIENIEEMVQNGELRFWGAFDNSRLVGIIALRGKQHISLLFIDSKFRRRGIAGRLVAVVIAFCREKPLKKRAVTVNASSYALEAYRHMGFAPLTVEQEKDGIRFTPMIYSL